MEELFRQAAAPERDGDRPTAGHRPDQGPEAAPPLPLRVCRVALYPHTGIPGAGLAPYHLTRALGLETLYLSRPVPGEPLALPPRTTLHVLDTRRPRGSGGAGVGWRAIARRIRDHDMLGYFLRSTGPMRRFRPDLVHVHGLYALLHAVYARVALGARVAITLHNSHEVRFFRKPFLRALLRRFDLVFYMDEGTREALRRLYPEERLAPTRTAADTSFFTPGGAGRERLLVCVASLFPKKDLPTLLRAFAALLRQAPEYRLVMAGEGPEREALTALRSELGLDDAVTFAGLLTREAVRDLLQRSRALVLSSLHEGSPKVIHEAVACGTPVVATDVGFCREAVGRAGIVVPPGDPAALAAALHAVVGDEARWRAFHAECLVQRSALGWEAVGEETRAAYARLFAGPAAAAPRRAPVVAGEAGR